MRGRISSTSAPGCPNPRTPDLGFRYPHPNIETEGDELSQADESNLYHHYQLNYTPPESESGRRLARR
jgi:hypothetical protein